jgi:ABC-2 type transport system permease protein
MTSVKKLNLVPTVTFFKTLNKYLRLYRAFFKASFVADMEFRANFLVRIFTDVLWYAAQILTFEVLFLHTPTLGGWQAPQMRVFLGILFVVDAIYMVLFHENLEKMNTQIRKGDIDLFLVKPVSAQFMITCQKVGTALVGNLIISIGWLWWSLAQLPDLSALRLFWLIVLIPSALIAIYSIRFVFSASAFLFTQAESIMYLWYQLYKLGLRPDGIYVPWLRIVVLTVIPVGFVASVPARAILEPVNYWLPVWVVLWSCTLLWMTTWLWKKGLKFYSSASS